jgi:hypothetical protein
VNRLGRGRPPAVGLLTLAIVITQLTFAGARPAAAAPGSVIADVTTPEGQVLSKSIAFDGRYLYYTEFNGTVLHRIDVPPAGGVTAATGHIDIPITGAPSGINAMSYDATRDLFWAAGGDGLSIYKLSRTGIATVVFTIDPATNRPGDCKYLTCSAETNGLAIDGTDDTLWYSPDATMRVYHYRTYASAAGHAVLVDATPYVDVDIPPNDMTPQCGYTEASGVAVGGDHLFILGGGCPYLFEYTKTGTKLGWIQYAYPGQSPWEIVCDNFSYPVSVFWARDAYYGHIRAIQQTASGACGYGGLPPTARTLKVTGPSSVEAGQPNAVTVAARDVRGNPVPQYAGRVHFTSSDTSATVVLPADSTLTSGQGTFSVTLTKAGAQTVSATDTVTASISGSASVTVTPSVAASLTLTAPATATANQAFNVTVTATDRFGNVATGYRGTVQFTTSDLLATLPANYAFSATDNGAHTFSVTLVTPPSQSLTVTDTATASLTASAQITVKLLPILP